VYPGELQPPKPLPEEDRSDLDLKRAYTGRRWIGLRGKGTSPCPDVAGWEVESLADQASRRAFNARKTQTSSTASEVELDPADEALLHDLGLDRFCIYTPREQGPWVEFVPPPGLVARQDRMALSTTSAGGVPSDDLSQKIWRDLATLFTRQTGQELSRSEVPGQKAVLRLRGEEPRVRLTFIDSQPDGEGALSMPPGGGSLHGFTLARFAQDIVCPSGPEKACAAKIATRRALGYRNFDPQQPLPPKDPVGDDQSGHVGLVSELATAIVTEVLYWRKVEPEKKLILNLSLGWDGERFGDLDARKVSQLEPSVRAVYEALRFARRSGALVIAASGNRKGGYRTEWPLLPAAWELRRPTCFLFGKPVRAVGGVDWQDLPLSNSREGGRPKRVAYADHSVTGFGDDEPTGMYTGTSVSAAVTSSIAAVVWHLRPELRPDQVMRLVTRSGRELPFRADFYAWRDLWPLSKLVKPPRAKRLSLCPAVVRACGASGRRCAGVAFLSECPPRDPEEKPEMWSVLQDLPGNQLAAVTPLPEASSNELIDLASQRWVIPQPEATPCPGCTVVPKEPPTNATMTSTDYELVLKIGDEWKREAAPPGLSLDGGTLFIDCSGLLGRRTFEHTIPKEILMPDSPQYHQVHRLPVRGVGKPLRECRAHITFRVKSGESDMSVLNPVFVNP
jgi:hypothetical protein